MGFFPSVIKVSLKKSNFNTLKYWGTSVRYYGISYRIYVKIFVDLNAIVCGVLAKNKIFISFGKQRCSN